MLLEDLLLSLQLLDRSTEPVTDVAVLGKKAQRPALAGSADQDLRTSRLHWAGDVQRTVDLVIGALE